MGNAVEDGEMKRVMVSIKIEYARLQRISDPMICKMVGAYGLEESLSRYKGYSRPRSYGTLRYAIFRPYASHTSVPHVAHAHMRKTGIGPARRE
jgi:hypothetical protein